MSKLTSPFLLLAVIITSLSVLQVNAQQLKITDFVLFAGQRATTPNNSITMPADPGFGVTLGSSVTINKGRIGSYTLIKSTGSSVLTSNLNSNGIIHLAANTKVNGSITVANRNNVTSNALQMGADAFVLNNIDVRGNIFINSGAVCGTVTHPSITRYLGPKPLGGEIKGKPSLPVLPPFPAITHFTTTGTHDITTSCTLVPGNYRDMKLTGNQKVTFSGPGDYYFKSIHNKNDNNLLFDFKGTNTGNIRVYVEGDVELDKGTSGLQGGGSAARIYFEVHGKGATCSLHTFSFTIANGSSWLGTVWAPYAAINIGSGDGTCSLEGAFYSATQVNIGCHVIINFVPYTGFTTINNSIVPGYFPPSTGKSTAAIGPELASLCDTYSDSAKPSPDIYRIVDSSVYIEVVAKMGYYNSALTLLRDKYGMTGFITNGKNSLLITGKISIRNLCLMDDDPEFETDVNSCRPVYSPITNTGLANTGGDSAMRSSAVRNAFHLSGKGIKVGVLSDGYNTIPGNPAAVDVANGDLPGIGNSTDSTPVHVLQDYPFGRSTDEGRAMLQIVHDVAPKAALSFRTGYISEGDFAQGISELQQDGCGIIADDITYITAPFFKDGLAAQAVNNVKALGVSYFSAAGNFGSKSYEAIFNPTTPPAGITGEAHNFGGGDVLQNDSLQPGSYTIVMQWEDSIYSLGQGGAKNDFDIYLTDDDGNILFGFNRPNIGADPIEVLPFSVTSATRTNIMVVRAAGNTANVRFKFIVYRGDLTFNEFSSGASTIVGQANATGAMAIAAARYTRTPAFGVSPALIESFSSVGGTPVYGTARNKPDFTAPDGGNTTVNFNSLDIEGDGIPNFFGTSAAAPHAAGVAALLLEGKKLFYNKILEPDSVRIILSNTASDMTATPGFDNISGYGLLQADSAVSSFAAPTPELDSVMITSDTTQFKPGINPVTVTIKGKYFRPNTVVTVRGVPVTTQILNSSEATAVVTPFSGNAPLQVYTSPITPSGLDGQYSQPFYFFSPVKKKVVIIADNKTKKYGERLPDFTSTILVNNVPLINSGLTLADLNLETIAYTTTATTASNVGFYTITPHFKTLTSADSLAFELYDYTFTNGVLFNNKMPLVVTPRDTTLSYGSKISGFHYKYVYGDSLIPAGEKSAFQMNVELTHDSLINNNVVAFVDGKSIINGRTLTDADLLNMGVIASGKSIINGRNIINGKNIVNNVTVTDTTKVIDLALQSIFNYQLDSSSSPLVNAKNIVNARAIVNAKSIVNGTAEVNAKNIVNGSPVLNSNSVGDTSNQNVVVIIDQADVTSDTNTLSELKSVNMVTGITTGNWKIVPAALISDNFQVSYGLGNLKIGAIPLCVKANDTLIYQGDSLPHFTSTITGLKNGDTLTAGPQYTLNPAYTGNAGTYCITPSNAVPDCPECYVIMYTPGTLYVNPRCSNTQPLKPYLVCVDTLINDPTGLKYVATFGCKNDNATVVYVPQGADNNISGEGSASAVGNVPERFEPGACNTFQIKFNGNEIIWTIKSYNNTLEKTTASQSASCSSQRCKESTTYALAGGFASAIDKGTALISPNPTKGKFVITTKGETISGNDLLVTDLAGKNYSAKVTKTSGQSIEIELPSGITNGVYFVRVKINNEYTIFRIIKM